MKKGILSTLLSAFLILTIIVPFAAAEIGKQNFLFVLDSDDSNKVTRCFQFAQIAHSKGHDVNIFLIDDGVIWAVPGKAEGIKALTGDSADTYLDYIIKNKVPISV